MKTATQTAGYDYRTPYGHFKVNGNMIHAFSYEGAACGAVTIASMKEVPVGDKANAIYAIVHRANAYSKLIERLNESQRLLDYRANQGAAGGRVMRWAPNSYDGPLRRTTTRRKA